MRRHGFLAFALLLTLDPAPATAQADAPARGWALHLGITRESFTGASSDTSTIPGNTVDVTPSPRLSLELGVGRRFGPWELSVSAGWAPGGLRAQTSDITLDDRSGGVDRVRGVLRIGREVLRLDRARLIAEAGLAIDHWSLDQLGDRTVPSGQGGLRLRVPLGGRMALEQSALFSLGGSPFKKSALPPEAVVSSLRTWSFGLALRRGW